MTATPNATALDLAVALGIGLLIGAERERRKGAGASKLPAGIRTFGIASLLGAVAVVVGGDVLLAVATLCVGALAAVAYRRRRVPDPGLTTEASLVLAVLLGGLAMHERGLASALGVSVALLLASRSRIHHFVRAVITEDELRDALIFAAAALVVLPLVPDEYVGPFAALNPRKVWLLVILVMSISAAGYLALRVLGPRVGLPLSGLTSGFVSSAATIGALGARAAHEPRYLRPAAAGAVLSTVATVIQMGVILAAVSGPALHAVAVPLVSAGIAAGGYAALFTVRALRSPEPERMEPGRPFRLTTALAFAAILAVVTLAAAALRAWLGEAGVVLAAGLAGFVDAHSAAASVGTLVAAGRLDPAAATLPILGALTTNTITKIVLARTGGGRTFAVQIVPGLVLVLACAWIGAVAHAWSG